MIYKVEFELSEATERQEIKETIDKSVMPKEQPTQRTIQQFTKQNKKGIMLGYAVYKLGGAIVETQALNDMTLRGDGLAAKMRQEKSQRTDKIVGSLFSFGMGVAIKGTVGGMFIAAQALKLATQAIAISMENQNLIKQNRQEKYINQFEQSRFTRNTTTERIRW